MAIMRVDYPADGIEQSRIDSLVKALEAIEGVETVYPFGRMPIDWQEIFITISMSSVISATVAATTTAAVNIFASTLRNFFQTIVMKQEPSEIGEPVGISGDLLLELRNTLLRCGPFQTQPQLTYTFVDNRISEWCYSLPDAQTPSERAKAVIYFLHDQCNDAGENALVLFLHVLRDSLPPQNACFRTLTMLAHKLEQELRDICKEPEGRAKSNRVWMQQLEIPFKVGFHVEAFGFDVTFAFNRGEELRDSPKLLEELLNKTTAEDLPGLHSIRIGGDEGFDFAIGYDEYDQPIYCYDFEQRAWFKIRH